jgi:flagellar hook protein FlgE
MDVIGTNISNVNTVGFKGSRVTFRDVLYTNMSTPTMPTDDPLRGGTNPSQIGLGVTVSSVDVLNTRAGPQTTDKPSDLYVDGEGYFRVFSPDGNYYYTRVGDFGFDSMGRMVDGMGSFVMGYSTADGEEIELEEGDGGLLTEGVIMTPGDEQPDYIGDAIAGEGIISLGEPDTQGLISQISIAKNGVITAYKKEDAESDAQLVTLGQVFLYKFPNNDGLDQVGNTYLLPTSSSGFAAEIIPGTNGTGSTISSRLEMSNVELAREFTDMITTQRGFQANSRIITVSDEMLQELVNLKRQ